MLKAICPKEKKEVEVDIIVDIDDGKKPYFCLSCHSVIYPEEVWEEKEGVKVLTKNQKSKQIILKER